jgi:hypothetical protein
MAAGTAAGQHGRILGLHRHDAHVRLALLEDPADPCDGSPGSHSGHEDVDFSVRVVPDLPAVVSLWTAGFAVLENCMGMNALSNREASSFAFAIAPPIPSEAGVRHQLCPEPFQKLPALRLMLSGHGDDQAIAPDGAHKGERDAVLPARGLDDNGARL